MDPRHELRVKIIQQLFALSFEKGKVLKQEKKTVEILKNLLKINNCIKEFALKYPINKISKVDLAILQLAIYELNFEKKTPPKVIIDEAIELSKELGSEKTFGFVNAVLGKVYNISNIKEQK
ncbi:MAG: transcription termination factor [uncultured bacterium]|nr:MAG: transcription termination factor [uncultured bacterium]